MKKLLSVLLCVLLCFSFVACIGNDDGGTDNSTSCTHTYDLATCTEPQKCSQCGATEGIALGHTYNSATCFEPQKCSQCGVTEGIALGHSYNPATCTEPQECSRCGATKGTALGHTTSTGTCTRCGTSFSKWQKRNYVDEFDNPTGEVFISPVDYLSGKFSNSATTNSKLTAYIRVDDSDFQIMLW